MDTGSRYEIVDTIASGDFATVYRARDRDLGREVAVKQIHQQFLANEQQLANYWREAQLLAQLQHPNVLTIYDIVRPRGWLILELMQGNLAPGPDGQPIDLDYLRVVLAGCLSALHFLHSNGVIHGDVKPSNMLFDKQKRVKLGDFGLARRASSDEGSLLKGTTKYMAPELVSNSFGAVGPASDLYSLGFSAYELMCGGQFESLFPGLAGFGRDKQIAWMMWHAAADRRLPAINRVLEGVPEDLALVIQRLVAKEQSHRYQSAADVLRNLRHDPLQVTVPDEPDQEDQAAALAEAKQKKRMRLFAVLALCFSVMVCIAMLLPKATVEKPVVERIESIRGVIRNVYPDERRFVLEKQDGQPKTIRIDPRDAILVNNQLVLLENLKAGDRVTVDDKVLVDEKFLADMAARHGEERAKFFSKKSGQRITVVFASRPLVNTGRIAEVMPDEGEFTLAYREGGSTNETQMNISVPANVPITFNEKDNLNGQKVTINELRVDDRVVVHHMGEDTGRVATELSITRVLTAEGVIRNVDAAAGQLTIAIGEEPNVTILTLPTGPKCRYMLNGEIQIDQNLLKLEDMQPGDTATIDYDTKIVSVDARRIMGDHGFVQSVQRAAGTINVLLDNQPQPKIYLIRPPCEITLADKTVQVVDLRDGDEVDITHDQPGAASPVASKVVARRKPDPSRWAILIANQNFEDVRLPPLTTPLADVALLRDALIDRYKVPPGNVHILANESLVRLQQSIPNYLRVKPTDSVLLYVSGHGYKDDTGQVYIAPKSFDMAQMNTTGLPLQWIVDQFEACPSKKKLLLLDTSHAGAPVDPKIQPSTAEQMRTLKAPPGRAPLRTVTAIASCGPAQRGLPLADKKTSLFPWLLSHAYSGQADPNYDVLVEPTELSGYLDRAMPGSAQRLGGMQTVKLFLPDDRPPRLSEAAKKAIRQLAGHLRQERIDPAAAEIHFADAVQLAGKEFEPRLLYGLVLMKAVERDAAFKHLEELKIERPDLLLPLQGIAWLRFQKRTGYRAGTTDLIEMISAIPVTTKPGQTYSESVRKAIYFAGQLRQFAAECPDKGYKPSPQTLARLDAAVKSRGPAAEQEYGNGVAATRAIYSKYDERAAGSGNPAEKAKIKIERRTLKNYVPSFPYDVNSREILGGLDR